MHARPPALSRQPRSRTIAILWHRLDHPGHDACRIQLGDDSIRLEGCAVFRESDQVFQLRYSVSTDSRMRTRRALVAGYAGCLPVKVDIRASAAGRWTLNGEEQSKVSGCLDVDLAFTPATNLLPLRRLMLRPRQEAQAPAAYLNLRQGRLTVLQQTYRRLSRREYRYEAPQFDYSDTLQVSDAGVVLHYPGLFEAVAISKRKEKGPARES